jgi:hypothetical protein
MGMPVEIRPADAADAPFLAEMLVAAAFWSYTAEAIVEGR